MPQNVSSVTDTHLKSIPLPSHGGAYTTVSNGFIIDTVKEELEANNFEVNDVEYTASVNGQVSQGIYHINYANDPDLGLMFAWGNSYDKSMRFRCGVGAYVFVCNNGMIAGDMSNYGRKHVGDADVEVKDHIHEQIKLASKYYNNLVADKNVMKIIHLNDTQIATLFGKLFMIDEVITSSQLIVAKKQMENPAHNYGTSDKCLWTIYNHITFALKKSHPKDWMESQKKLHKIVKDMFFPTAEVVDPNQLDLAEEAEKADALTELQQETGLTVVNEFQPADIEEVEEEVDENAPLSLDILDPEPELPESEEVQTDDIPEAVEDLKPEPQTDETGLLIINEFDDGDEPTAEEQMEAEDPDFGNEEEPEDFDFDQVSNSEELDPATTEQTFEAPEQEEVSAEEADFSEVEEDSEGQMESPDFEF